MMSKKDLIAQINRNLEGKPAAGPSKRRPVGSRAARGLRAGSTAAGSGPAAGASTPTQTPTPTPTASGSASGKQAAFWLDDEDRAIFHETGLLLYSQGIKPSHNLVLRAAIRLMPRDHRLVEKVRELMGNDGRKLRHARGKQ